MGLARPPRLLIGVNAAHSGSSSTYVTLGWVPDGAAYEATQTLRLIQPAPAPSAAPALATILRQGRQAGLLGAAFTPDPAADALTVSVRVGDKPPGSDRPGLMPEEARAVLDGIGAVARSPVVTELGAGRLEVGWAQAHMVDSSVAAFRDLAGKLPALLTLPADASAELVQRAWQRQAEAARLGPCLDHLDAMRSRRADFCAFRGGAVAAELAGFEARLGLALPGTVRMTLARMDGGSFVGGSCALLGLAEMEAAYFDLIASHPSHIELEGWQGHRVIRPRLRLPDGSWVVWPYLPVARAIGGHLLVVEALGGAWRNRVLDVRQGIGPRDWPVRYASHADFFEDFVATGGVLAR